MKKLFTLIVITIIASIITILSVTVFGSRIGKAAILTVKAEDTQYVTVTFHACGGSVKGGATYTKQVIPGTHFSLPSDSSEVYRTGYKFLGWYTYPDGGTLFTPPTDKDITVYAHWEEIIKYTVTFDSNGGSAVSSQTVVSGNKATRPNNPTRTGYEFYDWYLNGSKFDFNTPITENITLWANWVELGPTKYTVTFNSNGGSSVSSQTVESGNTATKPTNPSKSGYTFVNWRYNNSEFNFNTPITGDITLDAYWELTKYTVTFDAKGGTVSPTSRQVVSGSSVSTPTPTKTGYTFDGWYYYPNGSKTLYTNQAITKDITLYAEWKANKYTVTFNSNGGSSVASQTVEYGKKATKPANPTKDGYVFVRWLKDDNEFDFNTSITSNITLLAIWEKVQEVTNPDPTKYTITFNATGGTCSVISSQVEPGSSAPIPSVITRDGYTFDGWYTSADYTTKYTNQPINEDTTLYAKWIQNQDVTSPEPTYVQGDWNGDGKFTDSDAVFYIKYIAGAQRIIDLYNILTDTQKEYLNWAGDTKIDNQDVIRVIKYIAHKN